MQEIQNRHKNGAQYAAKPEICTKSVRNMQRNLKYAQKTREICTY